MGGKLNRIINGGKDGSNWVLMGSNRVVSWREVRTCVEGVRIWFTISLTTSIPDGRRFYVIKCGLFCSRVIGITEQRWKLDTSKNYVSNVHVARFEMGRRFYVIKCGLFCSRVIGITEQRWKLSIMRNRACGHVFFQKSRPNRTKRVFQTRPDSFLTGFSS